MDIIKAKDLTLHSCEYRLKDEPIHKRLAVLRYMSKCINDLPDYQIVEAVKLDTGKRELPEEVEYRLNLASERYDNWMAKHNRVVVTEKEHKEVRKHLKEWADGGFQPAAKSRA